MPDDAPAPGRRSFLRTVVLGLVGAALTLLAATRDWGTATTRSPAVRTATAGGPDVAPLVLPLALVALAAWGTVLVLRRRGRRVVAVLAVLAGAGAALSAALRASHGGHAAVIALGVGAADPGTTAHATAWPWVAVVGGVVTAATAAVAWWRAPTWPEMSSRYDAPGTDEQDAAPTPGADTTRDMWRALDEGRDPTAD
jgi:uncharacterized membrane protein (TIGR02234 family)